jgi:hypothetical protein
MASDQEYMAFLDQANRDPNEGYAKPQSQSATREFKATDTDSKVPEVITNAIDGEFYISDADEPFAPVYLSWDEGGKTLPDEGTFDIGFPTRHAPAAAQFTCSIRG